MSALFGRAHVGVVQNPSILGYIKHAETAGL